MTTVSCDACGLVLEKGLGIRVTKYGNTGINVTPRFKACRPSDEDQHFCSGRCLIVSFDFLGSVIVGSKHYPKNNEGDE